jgi:hypothetical protein
MDMKEGGRVNVKLAIGPDAQSKLEGGGGGGGALAEVLNLLRRLPVNVNN